MTTSKIQQSDHLQKPRKAPSQSASHAKEPDNVLQMSQVIHALVYMHLYKNQEEEQFVVILKKQQVVSKYRLLGHSK